MAEERRSLGRLAHRKGISFFVRQAKSLKGFSIDKVHIILKSTLYSDFLYGKYTRALTFENLPQNFGYYAMQRLDLYGNQALW